MKISICQINPTVGDLKSNRDKILSYYRSSVDRGAEIVVFPELAITGYPPQDLLLDRPFIDGNLEMLNEITFEVGSEPAILGHVYLEENHLYNSASVLQDGRLVARYDKILLPTYDVFDEHRYFSPGSKVCPVNIKVNGKPFSIGIEICEDLWDDGYKRNVTEELVKAGADVIINISASPYCEGKSSEREELIKNRIAGSSVSFLYCNLVGGQDELIFDGNSVSFSASGKLLAHGKAFEEDIIIVNLDQDSEVSSPNYSREEEIFKALKLGIQDYFSKTEHSKCVIGLSGGVDSALTACLAAESLGEDNVLCISMPSVYSSQHSKDDARALASNLGVEYKVISIGDLMLSFGSIFDKEFKGLPVDITEENIQARIRGNLLMAFANKMGFLVLSTGNKTELALGYCTLYGDMSGGLAVISDLHKTDVYALSQWYNEQSGKPIIPESIINKMPSAELAKDQVDPFDYMVVSPLVEEIVENYRTKEELIKMGYDPSLVQEITSRLQQAEFKRRQAAPGLRVTSKAFGIGRRYPIVNGFKE